MWDFDYITLNFGLWPARVLLSMGDLRALDCARFIRKQFYISLFLGSPNSILLDQSSCLILKLWFLLPEGGANSNPHVVQPDVWLSCEQFSLYKAPVD